jgi:membrane protease subunit (stomatin/prohibitin family)
MADLEIQSGAQLTVRESQMAAFVNEGRIADVFGPGLYTLNTRTLPLLTNLKNWEKEFQSPFKSDVFFFSTRIQIDQRWGTATPITIREKEFGAVRVRVYGIYSYRITDPRAFFTNVSGTQEVYHVEDLEGQLRHTIVARMTEVLAPADMPFLDMAANQAELARRVSEQLRPAFAALGIGLDSFVIQSLSLPEELQKMLDERIGMNLVGDMGRYTQFEAARSLPIAAANQGNGSAGAGVGLGAGIAMGQTLVNAVKTGSPSAETKFCLECGKSIPRASKFCPECGKPQP